MGCGGLAQICDSVSINEECPKKKFSFQLLQYEVNAISWRTAVSKIISKVVCAKADQTADRHNGQ